MPATDIVVMTRSIYATRRYTIMPRRPDGNQPSNSAIIRRIPGVSAPASRFDAKAAASYAQSVAARYMRALLRVKRHSGVDCGCDGTPYALYVLMLPPRRHTLQRARYALQACALAQAAMRAAPAL
jgi:hypothetical protein